MGVEEKEGGGGGEVSWNKSAGKVHYGGAIFIMNND